MSISLILPVLSFIISFIVILYNRSEYVRVCNTPLIDKLNLFTFDLVSSPGIQSPMLPYQKDYWF